MIVSKAVYYVPIMRSRAKSEFRPESKSKPLRWYFFSISEPGFAGSGTLTRPCAPVEPAVGLLACGAISQVPAASILMDQMSSCRKTSA